MIVQHYVDVAAVECDVLVNPLCVLDVSLVD